LISFTANPTPLSKRTMPATTRGEGMIDSPQTGLSTNWNNLALVRPPRP
jgi:hypothetical protein